jgi:putative CocE/NonD family hydrolase
MRSFFASIACAFVATALSAQQPTDDAVFDIDSNVLVKTKNGATLSAEVIRKKGTSEPLPAILTLDIYTDPAAHREQGKNVAARGYVSVIADTRGKRLSPDAIDPYEHEAADANEIIEWITRQPWSNGKIGMWGGSYSGFTAWAATKHIPAALKTIAVSAAAIPGLGLPMYNNVFLCANYGWPFYVADNKYLDEQTCNDPQRWRRMQRDWFASGRAYREIDRVDGTPNPYLQRWLQHPAYDAYWQRMVPYGRDFANIGIPVLTITGYYDDGQISALHYLTEHYRHNPHAEHYLVIGPYDHFGTHSPQKNPVLRGYTIDAVAQFSTPELKMQWMDYVLRNGPKPTLLQDRVNYEVMGANEWRHAPSLAAASRPTRLYFDDTKAEDHYRLTAAKSSKRGAVEQSVDFRNRNIFTGFHTYPSPIVQDKLEYVTELMFASDPFARPTAISGVFNGELEVAISKRDFDFTVTIYEQQADGKLFHLGYTVGRASFAHDPTRRNLLMPGRATRIPFQTTFVARQLEVNSRLLILLDVNKNPSAQVNYGTGKDVSDESIEDGVGPLQVSWFNDSYVNVPIAR